MSARSFRVARMVAAGASLLLPYTAAAGAWAQDSRLRVERGAVLSFDMVEQEAGPWSSVPYAAPSGLVWRRVIQHPQRVDSLRIHLVIRGSIGNPWRVRITDSAGNGVEQLEHSSPILASGEVWSDEVRGRSATVELWTDGDPTGLELVVDRYAYHAAKAVPQAIVGKNQLIPIHKAPVRMRPWGLPIARLRFMTLGGQATCTAFLVGTDLVITNQHCISNQSEMLSAVVEFGYDGPGVVPDRIRARALEATSVDLDYSVVRLLASAPPKYGRLRFQTTPPIEEARALVIVQHPGGQPKKVSIDDCKVSGLQRTGVGSDPTDFGHLCDTLGGSSGSPVLDWNTGMVVGLHHFGFKPGSPELVNQAVHIDRILNDLQQRAPAVYQEIH